MAPQKTRPLLRRVANCRGVARTSKTSFDPDLARLAGQAYHRLDTGVDLLKRARFFRASTPERFDAVARLYEWFLAPLSLWPCNTHDLLAAALDLLEAGRSLDSSFLLLLSILPPPPSEKAIRAATEHEHHVQAGHYENLVTAAETKFLAEERELRLSKALKAEWRKIKEAFPVADFADHKGIVRRSLVPERNLRSDFSVDWSDSVQRFQSTFDVFCAKWNLYGMQGNKPLLLKLSVNLTAHGTMIFIPAYWSPDFKRDFNFKGISQLHRARVPHRQGKVISENRQHRRAMAAKLHALDAEAKKQGLRGEAKQAFLCKRLGLHPETDARQFSRLRKEFPI